MNKNSFFFKIFAFGFLVFISSKFFHKKEQSHPLVIVNGIVAPRLSSIVFHLEKPSDSGCINCHISSKEIFYNEKSFVPPKIPHENRDNCQSCHILEL